ncbi:MAG TPA: PqqD family protein [Bacteroidaceae bacterium]|nr:PqqD family protein [Bacteroidaceae bacterium]
MKQKKGFELRSVCGEQIIVAKGLSNIDFSKVIQMNESSAYLWQEVKDKDFTPAMLAELLTKEYDIDYDTALKDATELMEQWLKAGICD